MLVNAHFYKATKELKLAESLIQRGEKYEQFI